MIVYKTDFQEIKLLRRGKVRDVYDLGDSILFIATDRISAFDVIMNQAIPEKGKILTSISVHWFNNTRKIIDNHLITNFLNDFPIELQNHKEQLEGRSIIVRKCKTIPIECIVRGYIAGSGWKEYQKSGTICKHKLPDGLIEFAQLPEPIFTPSTKAEEGHDENISFEESVNIIGKELAEKIKHYSLELYKFAHEELIERGIILADTKFEFGIDESGEVLLIDEALTPDSSRLWLKENYKPGREQTNFDKQVLRDYLESIDWNKQPPPPELPANIIELTIQKYQFALDLIVR